MRELLLEIPKDGRPSYLRIADAMRAAIRDGRLKRAELVPSTRRLSATLKSHRLTVMAALQQLSAEGWLVARPRRGYEVAAELPDRYLTAATSGSPDTGVKPLRWRIARPLGSEPDYSPDRYRHNFRSGLPDLRLFPFAEFKSHISDSLRRSRPSLFGIGGPAGHPALIDELQSYLRRARAIQGREVVITHGSQEGIFLAGQVLLAPGDAVAVEGLGYPPAWDALRAAGARLLPVPVDAHGMDVAALERIVRKEKVRLIYTTPLHQYPTTATLPAPRRLALYSLAARRGIPIVEDDYDHEFHYRCRPIAPMAAADPAGLVIYVSTFSKVLFPSARLGFIAAPPALASALRRYRSIVTRQINYLSQDAMARWMRDGGFERHLRRMRKVYEERGEAIVDSLTQERTRRPALTWRDFDGGMAVWADIGSDSAAAAARARAAGIYVQPEAAYSLRGGRGSGLRLGFANQTPDELRRGVRALFDALEA